MSYYEQIDRQKYQKQITELQKQNQKLIEALEGIAKHKLSGSPANDLDNVKEKAQQALDETSNSSQEA